MRFLAIFNLAALVTLVSGLTWRGADISSVINLENAGRKYTDGGKALSLETILKNHGANLARIRVWTSSSYSQYSLQYGLDMAKRAKAAGLTIMIDLHYSDTWADPANQRIPSGWPTDLAGLNTKIYTYTKDLVTAFANQGTPIGFIQIGNEISDGLLWPTGRASSTSFDGTSQLLHSAVSGVRAASSSVKTIIHIANGWDSSLSNWFFGGVFRQGQLSLADVDVIAFSFYPFYDSRATYSALKSNLQAVISKYNKDIMIVETDWPVSCPNVAMSEKNIPISAAGQSTWVRGIRDVLSSVGSRAIGIVYWEPAWIGNANLGSGCADNLLVDSNGATRSSINMFSSDM